MSEECGRWVYDKGEPMGRCVKPRDHKSVCAMECGRGHRPCVRPAGHTGGHSSVRPVEQPDPVRLGMAQAFCEWADEIERLSRMVVTANAQRDEAFAVASAAKHERDEQVRGLRDLLYRTKTWIDDGMAPPDLLTECDSVLYGDGEPRLLEVERELAAAKGEALMHEATIETLRERLRYLIEGVLGEAEDLDQVCTAADR